MGKPRMIILIRHAQSEGNKNRDIHQSIPDHRVKLTPLGWQQAHAAGLKLRGLLRPDDTIQFFTSPYTRTRETTQGILSTLCSDDPDPSPFPLSNIKVYEEPRLREQDFGNFQPCSAEMERMWQERADYGHFFYRIPNGESAADAYDRVAGFNESLWRQFGEDDCASVCVLVTHGLMSRVFLMKWYHFSVEYFEDLRNVDHCEFLIMRKEENGKYNLETKLRTWSGLKRERALALKERAEKDMKEGKISKEPLPLPLSSPHLAEMATGPKPGDLAPVCTVAPAVPKRKKWGGCPNGCDHGRFHYKKENSMHSMKANGGLPSSSPVESPPVRRHFHGHFGSSSDEDEVDPRGIPAGAVPGKAVEKEKESHEEAVDLITNAGKGKPKTSNNHSDRNIHNLNLSDLRAPTPSSPITSPARNPPQYITRSGTKTSLQRADRQGDRSRERADRTILRGGRDGGGTGSGREMVGSDTETDIDAEMARKAEKAVWRMRVRERREGREGGYPGMGIGGLGDGRERVNGRVRADGLGDRDGGDMEKEGSGEEGGGAVNGDTECEGEGGQGSCQHEPLKDGCRGGDSEGDRGGEPQDLQKRKSKVGKVPPQVEKAKKTESVDEISPGSVREVHEAVVNLGFMPEASESAEFDAEDKKKFSLAVKGAFVEKEGEREGSGNGEEETETETGEDRHEKSVAGQVR